MFIIKLQLYHNIESRLHKKLNYCTPKVCRRHFSNIVITLHNQRENKCIYIFLRITHYLYRKGINRSYLKKNQLFILVKQAFRV